MSDMIPAILSEPFSSFPQSLHVNAGNNDLNCAVSSKFKVLFNHLMLHGTCCVLLISLLSEP
jgi:hypothetical protein